jgi:membrane protein implicated in regulation of membrane protease activity
LGFKDWNPLKVIALGVLLCLIGGLGLGWRINLGFVMFLALGVYATLLGIRYSIQRRRQLGH